MLGRIPLQLLVSLVAHDGGPAPGQALLGDVHVVALHPLWPVATVTAVDESGALQEEGSASDNWSFLIELGCKYVT